MTQYSSIPETVDAEQFRPGRVDALRKWGVGLQNNTGSWWFNRNGHWEVIEPGDWLVRQPNGTFTRVFDDEFRAAYRVHRADDEQAVSFALGMVSGAKVAVTVEGWKQGSDAARALMHVGRPQVVLEFLKEQAMAGDMSVLTLMNELAAVANPGE